MRIFDVQQQQQETITKKTTVICDKTRHPLFSLFLLRNFICILLQSNFETGISVIYRWLSRSFQSGAILSLQNCIHFRLMRYEFLSNEKRTTKRTASDWSDITFYFWSFDFKLNGWISVLCNEIYNAHQVSPIILETQPDYRKYLKHFGFALNSSLLTLIVELR